MADLLGTRKLKISQLRALVAVADHHNFSEAALEMGVSQSSVSHAIATLEEDLGVVVLNRGRHGAVPTPVGETIINHARHVLQSLDDMVTAANHAKGIQRGHVRVATFRSLATHLLPLAIAQLQHQFPDLTIQIVECSGMGEVEQQLRQGQSEVAVATLPETEGFESWELWPDQYVALVPSQTFPDAIRLTWQQLASRPILISAYQDCSRWIDNYVKQAEASLNISHRMRSDSTIVGMVLQDLGIGILPRMAAEPIPNGVRMCQLPEPLHRTIAVSVLAKALHTPATFALIKVLKEIRQPSLSVAG
jgi:DNA-binding transcriptional LysR family regulator